MAKRKSGALLTRIVIDRDSRVPLFRQFEDQLRGAILAGSLSGATRLPTSRALAVDLGVSRMTVVQVLKALPPKVSWTFAAVRAPLSHPRSRCMCRSVLSLWRSPDKPLQPRRACPDWAAALARQRSISSRWKTGPSCRTHRPMTSFPSRFGRRM